MKKLLSIILALMLVLATPLGVLSEEGASLPPADAQVATEVAAPTQAPTEAPTEAPAEEATEAPTEAPAEEATEAPTEAPAEEATEAPTEAPAEEATEAPTEAPAEEVTEAPTEAPAEEVTEAPTEAPAEEATEADETSEASVPLAAPANLKWDEFGNLSFDTVVPATDKYLVTIYCDGDETKQIEAKDVPGDTLSVMIPADQIFDGQAGEYTFAVIALGFDVYLDSEAAVSPAFTYEPAPEVDPYADMDAVSALLARVEAGEITILQAREALLSIADIGKLLLDNQAAIDALGALEALYKKAAGIALDVDVDDPIAGTQLIGAGLNAWENPQELHMQAAVLESEGGNLRLSFALEAIQPEPKAPVAHAGALQIPVYVTIPLAKEISADTFTLTGANGRVVPFAVRNNKIHFVLTSLGEYQLSQTYRVESDRGMAEIKAFVTRLYVNVLGRQPETKGLNEWCNGLANGVVTGAQTCAGFYISPELAAKKLTDRQYIENLYATCLNRKSDTKGMNDWLKALSAGATRVSVMNGFMVSPEFGDICRSYGITRGTYNPPDYRDKNMQVTMFVVRLYKNFLGRSPDTKGLEDWCKALLGVGQSGSQVAWGFYSSPEFQRKSLTDDQFITVLYNTLLDRSPDAKGLSDWRRSIAMYGYQSVFTGFIVSPEWKALMNQYGINAATFTPPTPTYRALIIGQYNYGDHFLLGCDKDATAMNTLLGTTVPAYNRTLKRNQTASGILSSIKTAFAGAKETDVSLFYYSGHGYGSTAGSAYNGALCGVDTNSANFSGDVTPTQLRNALDAVPGKVIVLLDSCFSGSYIREKESGGKVEDALRGELYSASDRDMALNSFNNAVISAFSGGEVTDYWSVSERDPRYGELKTSKYVVLTASRWYELSEGDYLQSGSAVGAGGVFTSFLCYGAGWDPIAGKATSKHADTNKDGTVSVNEAFVFINNSTYAWAQHVTGYTGSTIYPLFKFQ